MRTFSLVLLALLALVLPALAQQPNATRDLVRDYQLRAVHGVPRLAALAFSPEGDVLYAAGTDDMLRIFDTNDLALVGSWDHKGASVTFVSPSPDGSRVAVGDDDGTITVRDAATGEITSYFEGGGRAIVGLEWDPAANRVAATWLGGPLRVLDLDTGRPVGALIEGPGEWFGLVAVHFPTGVAASAGRDGDVRVFELRTGRTLRVIRGGGVTVVELRFSPSGAQLAVGEADGRTKIRNVADGALQGELPPTARGGYAFSPDGKHLFRPSADGGAEVRDTTPEGGVEILVPPQRWTGLPLDEERDPARGETRARRAAMAAGPNAAVSADGQYLAEAWGDELRMWHLGARKLVNRRDTGLAAVVDVDFSPDARMVAAADRAGVVRVRLSESGFVRGVFTLPKAPVLHMDWSPDGRFIAVAGPDFQVRVWEVLAAQTARTLFGHEQSVTDVAFNKNNTLASASSDGAVVVWDIEKRQSTSILPGVTGGTSRLIWSTDGKRLAGWGPARISAVVESSVGRPTDPSGAAKPRSVALIDPATKKSTPVELVDHPGGAGVFSADGKRFYSAGEGVSAISLGATPARVWQSAGHYSDLALSPDGRILLAADRDGTVDMLDAENGALLRSLSGHTGRVNGVVFSADGAWIASASEDGTVRVYAR